MPRVDTDDHGGVRVPGLYEALLAREREHEERHERFVAHMIQEHGHCPMVWTSSAAVRGVRCRRPGGAARPALARLGGAEGAAATRPGVRLVHSGLRAEGLLGFSPSPRLVHNPSRGAYPASAGAAGEAGGA